MSATLLYRIASVVLILFAAGHTTGFLTFKPASPEGIAVHDAMDSVHFTVGSNSFTYGGFYRGFGLYITAYLLFSALVAWHLGGVAASRPDAIGILGWAFFALQLASIVLSWLYFFPVTAVFSAAAAVCVGWANWLAR